MNITTSTTSSPSPSSLPVVSLIVKPSNTIGIRKFTPEEINRRVNVFSSHMRECMSLYQANKTNDHDDHAHHSHCQYDKKFNQDGKINGNGNGTIKKHPFLTSKEESFKKYRMIEVSQKKKRKIIEKLNNKQQMGN